MSRRRPHLIDRFPPDQPSPEEEAQEDAQYPGGPLLKLAPHQADTPDQEAPAAAPKVRGRTSAPVVVTAVAVATFISIAFQVGPPLYGSALLGGAACWCGMLAGLIAAMEAARWWWLRPWRARFRGVAWGLRLAWTGLAWTLAWAWHAAVAPRPREQEPGRFTPPGEGPWLMTVTSRSGQAISGRGPLVMPGEQPGGPTTVLFLRDAADLASRYARASADPDLTVTVRPSPWASPQDADAWVTRQPAPEPPPMPAPEQPAGGWPEPDPVYQIGPPPPASGRPRPENRRVAEPSLPALAIGQPAPKAQLRISSAHGATTPGWDGLITETGDWYADSDEEWLDRSRSHVIGMGRYAQSLLDAYEAQVYETGVDPNALAGWLLFAEAAADSAETMADGRRWFVQYLSEYRDAARQGKHPPKDPHWVTGEGEAD